MLNHPGKQLAVLHPRQLSVYQLSRRQGSGSHGTDSKNESQEISTGRKLVSDWNFGVGKPISDIQVIPSHDKDYPSTVVILGRQTLRTVLDTGGTLWSKRLESSPCCMITSPSLMYDKRVISLFTTDTGTLMLYDDTTLKWATQLPYNPACMMRGRLWDRESSATQDGLLVFLSDDGEVTVSYLGSDPTLFTAPPPDSKEVNYNETDRELSKLSALIKQSQKDGTAAVSSSGNLTLKMEVSVSSQLEMCQYPSKVLETEPAVPMVAITVHLHTPSPLTRVRVNLHVTQPLVLSQNTHTITSLTDTETLRIFAFLSDTPIVSSLELNVVTTYMSADGVPYSLHQSVQLPLSLVIKPCPPIKNADFKVTLSTNTPAVSLLELFPEFVLDSSMTNAAGFQLYGGPVITVLSSKTSQRYRLQSENLPSTWIMTDFVKRRLEQKFKKPDGSSDIECSYSSSLPLQEFFQEIDSHFSKRSTQKMF